MFALNDNTVPTDEDPGDEFDPGTDQGTEPVTQIKV